MKGTPLFNVRKFAVPVPWPLLVFVLAFEVAVCLVGVLFSLVTALFRYRRVLPELAAGLLLMVAVDRYGWLPTTLTVAALVAVLALWWWRGRASCQRLVLWPLLARWRRLWVYGRQWNETLTLTGLVKVYEGGQKVPVLLSVRCNDATDVVRVRMPRGQTPEVWYRQAQALALAFGTRHCRVYSTRRDPAPVRSGRLAWLWRAVDRIRFRDRPRLLSLVFIRRDPLRAVVAPLPVPTTPDFTRLPMGLCEDLSLYLLRLLATHVLIIGATRAGKGSVIWSVIRAVAGGVLSGLVRLWVIDPKGGMEMALGESLFSRYEDTDFTAMAQLLDDAIAEMNRRKARLRGKVRVHAASTDEPLILIVIDELAALLAYLQDVRLRERITQSLAILLSQGAGLGVLVVGATQDPRKEVLSLRDLFPTRIALRLNDADQVDMSLGLGSRSRGALADHIPRTMPGTAYVVLSDRPEPVRVRFSFVDDDLIRDMAATYPAPTPAPVPLVPKQATPAKPARPVDRDRTVYRPTRPLLPDSLLGALNPDRRDDLGESA
ncbi:hypothetical protein GCM10010123_24620 [Pilimelia anulata]|uniref:FtsK domain-containing protein n=1 Tax=Pilimelia anulata TaxID=53371 RepID=A0A8J3B4X0_9ACTN|nr:FtsK/SpoIIIE domain-containing protein [Pilimelia anulata]GGJ93833.1 hypothetical protein GCM10010123_24620 [Pilimelia anulata]